jgi:hypothetical protein
LTVYGGGGTLVMREICKRFQKLCQELYCHGIHSPDQEWINVAFLFGMRQLAQKPFLASFLTTLIGFVLICPVPVKASLKDLTIPSSFGIIREIHEPIDALDSPEIIQIQDAHATTKPRKILPRYSNT